jgi:hypothetical protein
MEQFQAKGLYNDVIDSFYHEGDGLTLKILNTVLPIVAIVLGTIGESISIVIFFNKKFMATSFAFYNISVSVIDILIFYIGCLKFVLQANTSDPLSSSMFWCKSLSFLIRPMLEIASWIQLLMTLDRFLFMHFTSRFKWIRKFSVQIAMVSILAVAFLLFHSPVAFFYGHFEAINETENVTSSLLVCYTDPYQYYVVILNDFGLFFIFCTIPFTIMFFLTISISISFIKMKKKSKSKMSSKNRKEYRFAFAIIFQNIIFLIFTLPLSTLWPVMNLKVIGVLQFSDEDAAVLDILLATFNFLMYFYFASKFLVNIIFNSLYRQIFIETFIYCMRRDNQNAITNAASKTT